MTEEERVGLTAAWSSLPRSQREKVSVVEYYCEQRHCALLTAFRTPQGLFVWLPRYRKSSERNAAQSVPAARSRRTVDGDRRWRGRVIELEEVAHPLLEAMGVELNCDHVSRFLPGTELLADVKTGSPGEPSRRRFA